jgi:hypothetical protein
VSRSAKPQVFISYSRFDNLDAFVEQFASRLGIELGLQLGHEVTIHVGRNPREAGGTWRPGLKSALDQSDFLVPIITPSYLKSMDAFFELGAFRERHDGDEGSIFPIHYVDVLSDTSKGEVISTLSNRQWVDWRELRFDSFDSPQVSRAMQHLASSIRTAFYTSRANLAATASASLETVVVERLQLENFRCFKELDLYFGVNPPTREVSTLSGNWSCLAGINGAGKSSILQAIAIALLGDLGKELGGGLLARMRTANMSPAERSSITVTASLGDRKNLSYSVQIDAKGGLKTNSPSAAESTIVLGYGATRNLGDEMDSRSPFRTLSPPVQAVIGMFRPLTQLAGAEVLLTDQRRNPHLLPLFQRLVREIFESEFTVEPETGSPLLRFGVSEKDRVPAVDLPDGFRSSAAWLADLCATWCERRPELAASGDPALIEAIVMIDEIDLHLHPGLQRELVPRLRKALPKVQWIVTTHSPLVLANFDLNEIIALDRDAEGNVRRLDRQILNFSMDEIYDWLMRTRPSGAAMEQILQQEGQSETERTALAELMRTTPTSGPATAHQQVSEFRDILKSLKR